MCERCWRRRCSRRKFQPTSISSTASSAERPRHGAPAACALSPLKSVLDRDEPVARAVAPADADVRADVREERDVNVLEYAGADEVRLGADQLLGDAGPHTQRAGEMLALHDLLHGDAPP